MTTSTPRSVRSWACRAVPRAGSGHAADPLKFDVIGLLARHPKMAQRFLSYKGWLLQRGELPLRLRELAILRVAHSRRSAFFWGEHVKKPTELVAPDWGLVYYFQDLKCGRFPKRCIGAHAQRTGQGYGHGPLRDAWSGASFAP